MIRKWGEMPNPGFAAFAKALWGNHSTHSKVSDQVTGSYMHFKYFHFLIPKGYLLSGSMYLEKHFIKEDSVWNFSLW